MCIRDRNISSQPQHVITNQPQNVIVTQPQNPIPAPNQPSSSSINPQLHPSLNTIPIAPSLPNSLQNIPNTPPPITQQPQNPPIPSFLNSLQQNPQGSNPTLTSQPFQPYPTMQPSFSSFQPPPFSNPQFMSFMPSTIPPVLSFPPHSTSQPHLIHSLPTTSLSTPSSIPFASLADPIKLFDGRDHTYPRETFLAQLSARVTFQLGPQPQNLTDYTIWHSRRMSLLYLSLIHI